MQHQFLLMEAELLNAINRMHDKISIFSYDSGFALSAQIKTIQYYERKLAIAFEDNMMKTSSSDVSEEIDLVSQLAKKYQPYFTKLDQLHYEVTALYLKLPPDEKIKFMKDYLQNQGNVFLYENFISKVYIKTKNRNNFTEEESNTLLAYQSDVLKLLGLKNGYEVIERLNDSLHCVLGLTVKKNIDIYLFEIFPDQVILEKLMGNYILTDDGTLYFITPNREILQADENAKELLSYLNNLNIQSTMQPLGGKFNCIANSLYFTCADYRLQQQLKIEIDALLDKIFPELFDESLDTASVNAHRLELSSFNILLALNQNASLSYFAVRSNLSPKKDDFITPKELVENQKNNLATYVKVLRDNILTIQTNDIQKPILISPNQDLQLQFPTHGKDKITIKIGFNEKRNKISYIYSQRFISLYHEFVHMIRMLNGTNLQMASTLDLFKMIYRDIEEFSAIQMENKIRNELKLIPRLTHNGFFITINLDKQSAMNCYILAALEVGLIDLTEEQYKKLGPEDKVQTINNILQKYEKYVDEPPILLSVQDYQFSFFNNGDASNQQPLTFPKKMSPG